MATRTQKYQYTAPPNVVFHNSAAAVTKESNPEFFAVVKRNPDGANGGGSLLPRPPSDHFYFKITDGKTEFI